MFILFQQAYIPVYKPQTRVVVTHYSLQLERKWILSCNIC